MRENFSNAQKYALEFIQRVGCASVQQMQFILKNKFGISPGQAINVLHSLEQHFFVSVSDTNQYVTSGFKDDKYACKMDMNTIMALQVALDVIGESTDDYDTIYKPYANSSLRFFYEDISFEVVVASLDAASKIRFLDDLGKSQFEADKKVAGEERAVEMAYKFLYVFPHSVNKKEASKMITSLNVFMPHSIAYIDGNNYFIKQSVTYEK